MDNKSKIRTKIKILVILRCSCWPHPPGVDPRRSRAQLDRVRVVRDVDVPVDVRDVIADVLDIL